MEPGSFGGMEKTMYLQNKLLMVVAVLLGLAAGMSLFPNSANARAACYSLEPAIVSLKGVVVTDAGGSFFLVLNEPICVRGEGMGGDVKADNVVRMHLTISTENGVAELRQVIGKEVELTGGLFDAHTAHHKTEILMSIKKIRKISPI
jgi:hypothetical protein